MATTPLARYVSRNGLNIGGLIQSTYTMKVLFDFYSILNFSQGGGGTQHFGIRRRQSKKFTRP